MHPRWEVGGQAMTRAWMKTTCGSHLMVSRMWVNSYEAASAKYGICTRHTRVECHVCLFPQDPCALKPQGLSMEIELLSQNWGYALR